MRVQELSIRVAAFKVAAALEQYEMDVRALVERRPDRELTRRLGQQLRELRNQCASLPRLSVSWAAVLVSQARLVQAACTRAGPATAVLLQEHLAAAETLRKRCLGLLGSQGVVLA